MGNRQPRSLFPEDRTQRQDPAPARAPGLPRCALKNGFGVHTRFCMLPLIERHLTHIHTYAHTHRHTYTYTHTHTHTQQYFQSDNEGGKTYLEVEWTNQHGCSGRDDDDDQKSNCNLVLQYMCHKDCTTATGTVITGLPM